MPPVKGDFKVWVDTGGSLIYQQLHSRYISERVRVAVCPRCAMHELTQVQLSIRDTKNEEHLAITQALLVMKWHPEQEGRAVNMRCTSPAIGVLMRGGEYIGTTNGM